MFGSVRVKLAELMEGVSLISAVPKSAAAAEISGLAYDSRKVGPGFLFFAFPGSKADGRQFAAQAVDKGAVAVISEAPAPAGFTGTWLRAAHGRHALATASSNFYNHPD